MNDGYNIYINIILVQVIANLSLFIINHIIIFLYDYTHSQYRYSFQSFLIGGIDDVHSIFFDEK